MKEEDDEDEEEEDFVDDSIVSQFGRGVESAKTLAGSLGIINRKMKDALFNVAAEKGNKRCLLDAFSHPYFWLCPYVRPCYV